jgi:hypothetical protein
VWIWGGIFAEQCPVSTINERSVAWLELFAMWRSGIVTSSGEWWAKDLEAMAVLQCEERAVDGGS